MSKFDELSKNAGLNKCQKKFCKIPVKKNVKLLAPAGSGKTLSLLWRCKFITMTAEEKNDPVPHFLLVAFTRAAKMELEDRLKNDENFNGINATVRTLNAWGWEQIKKTGKELLITKKQRQTVASHDFLPLYKNYPLIGNAFKSQQGKIRNSSILMDVIDGFKSLGFTHYMNKSEYNKHVKYLKELGLMPILDELYESVFRIEGIQNESKDEKIAGINEFFNFWKKAVIYLDSVNRYTLEDQKYWARIYLDDQIKNSKSPQGITRYTHVMVDEFQDINPLDMELLKNICDYHGQKGKPVSVTVVGDDDQAIFGWRGTTPKYILYPEKYFDLDFTTCVLDTNYRSPKNIVEISRRLLSYNKEREPKDMKSAAKGKATIKVTNHKKVINSIDAVMKLISSLMNDDKYRDIALIGRRQVSLFPYQVLLSSSGIEYYVDADIDIFDGEAMISLQSIIKTIYRAKDNDVDDPIEAVLGICDKIDRFKLSNKDRSDISDYLARKSADTFDEVIDALKDYPDNIKSMKPTVVCKIIESLVAADTVYKFMTLLEKNLRGFEKDYTKKDIDAHFKEPQFFRLTEISKRYGEDFRSFSRDIEKARKSGERCRNKSNSDSEEAYKEICETRIHLITATRSKGHEYDAVIILDVDDNEWPNSLSDDIEEERRLFYVALSRARKYLCFVTSKERLESRFLLEMDLI